MTDLVFNHNGSMARLILGDSLQVVPNISGFQAVLADPQYGIDKGKGGDAKDFKKGDYRSEWGDTEEYVQTVCVKIIEMLLPLNLPMAVTPGNRCLTFYPRARDLGCFWTPAAATHGPWGFTTMQPILYYGKDWRAGKGALPSGKQVTERAEKNGHPCPKPEGAWMWLCDKVAAPASTVLDPFMGSGTSAIVALKSGRSFIGVEKDPVYFEIAVKRLLKEFPMSDPMF